MGMGAAVSPKPKKISPSRKKLTKSLVTKPCDNSLGQHHIVRAHVRKFAYGRRSTPAGLVKAYCPPRI